MGRPRRSLTPQEARDAALAQQLPPRSGLRGYLWAGATATELGKELCGRYNTLKADLIPCFRYLLETLAILTRSERASDDDRREVHVFWMSQDSSRSGSLTLRGTSVPRAVAAALLPPNDGSPHRLYPFGRGLSEALVEAEGHEEDFLELFRAFEVEDGDVDGTIKRIARRSVQQSAGAPGKFLIGRGPDKDKQGRTTAPVTTVGLREAREMVALVQMACYTTATGTYLLSHGLGVRRSVAELIWNDLVHGHGAARTILCAGPKNGGVAAMLAKYGEAERKRVADQSTQTAALYGSMCLTLGPDFRALVDLATYLLCRYQAGANYEPTSGMIRLCRNEDCPAPAFVWAPPKQTYKHGQPKGKAAPKHYCKACHDVKGADRSRRYRRRAAKKRG